MNLSQIVFPYLSHRFSTEPTKIKHNFRNKVLQEIDLSKNVTDESCSTNRIFLAENHFQKDLPDFQLPDVVIGSSSRHFSSWPFRVLNSIDHI